ncbi:hypothetical protein K2P96_00645 [Patescibacteria group bacterium]|nr:hypothetical protein [Patescibacteria group bacterium]
MKLEFFKKKAKVFKKGGFHTNPDVAWEIVVYLALALIIAVLAYSIFFFRDIDKGFSVPDTDVTEQSKAVGKDRIDKVLKFFSDREDKTNQILSSPAPFVDPSL